MASRVQKKEGSEDVKIITLTDEQASTLEVYLLITTKYRQGEIEASESLSRELDENGSPKYPKMKSNAKWWRKVNGTIEEIKTALKNAEYKKEE